LTATIEALTAAAGDQGVVLQEVPIGRVKPARDNPRGKDVGDVDGVCHPTHG
jgi:hypothetical protein